MKQGNKNKKLNGMLKISELAKAAGESVSTIKYYVKEGLVEIAFKTGKNMAYYAPESVERVKLIRTLQTEKFYPLSVIKHILGNKDAGDSELALLDIINKADKADYYERLPVTDAAKQSKLKPREAEALIRSGLIVPTMSGHTRMCTRGDFRLMKLAQERLQAGIPLEQTIRTFSMYESHLIETTKKDIESLVRESILTGTLGTEDIMRIINVSDETLDSFICMKRYAMNASLGADYIAKTEKLKIQLEAFVKGIYEALKALSHNETAALLEEALSAQTGVDKTISAYSEMLHIEGTGLANMLAVLFRAGNFFREPAPRTASSELDMVHDALRLGWLAFAPEEFGCNPIEAKKEFVDNIGDKILCDTVLRLIQKLQD